MKHMSDYHDLIAHVNVWAVSLGFLVKLKRPPKVNQDGSKTLRVYCASFKKSKPLDEDASIVASQTVSRCGTTIKTNTDEQLLPPQSQAPSMIGSGTQSVSSNLTKTEEMILKPLQLGVRCCNFGLTFKSDP